MADKFKAVLLDTMIEKHIGERGTERREAFENELRTGLLGQAIKQESKFTEEQLGDLVVVQNAQITKIENSAKNELDHTRNIIKSGNPKSFRPFDSVFLRPQI